MNRLPGFLQSNVSFDGAIGLPERHALAPAANSISSAENARDYQQP
jgi:hypothetical protein